MSAVALAHVNATISPPVSSAPAPSAAASDPRFSVLLSGLSDSRATPHKGQNASPADQDTQQSPATASETAAGTATPLQSLEAALAALAAPAPAARPSPTALSPSVASTASTPANATPATASPLASALSAATNVFDTGAQGSAGAFNAAVPLKAQLQADASLGLTSFQMKTFLAAAGATPARAGATALHSETAWPLLAKANAATPSSGDAAGDGSSTALAVASSAASAFPTLVPLTIAPAANLAVAPSASTASDASLNLSPPVAEGATSLPPTAGGATDVNVVANSLAAIAPPGLSSPPATSAARPANPSRDTASDSKSAAISAFAFSPAGDLLPRDAPAPVEPSVTTPASAAPAPAVALAAVATSTLASIPAVVVPRSAVATPEADTPPRGPTAAGTAAPARAAAQTAMARVAVTAAAPAHAPGSTGSRRDNAAAASTNTTSATAQATATLSADAASTATPTIVAFSALPGFIADQANSMIAAASPDAPSAAATTATPTTAKAAQAVKELEIALDPADLGAMTLKLRLASGKLSVTIAVANPQTLAAIEDDRDLIAARLASSDSSLGDLVIQRQSLTNPQTAATDASSSDSAASPSSENDSKGAANPRAGAYTRRSAGAGRSLGDLSV